MSKFQVFLNDARKVSVEAASVRYDDGTHILEFYGERGDQIAAFTSFAYWTKEPDDPVKESKPDNRDVPPITLQQFQDQARAAEAALRKKMGEMASLSAGRLAGDCSGDDKLKFPGATQALFDRIASAIESVHLDLRRAGQ